MNRTIGRGFRRPSPGHPLFFSATAFIFGADFMLSLPADSVPRAIVHLDGDASFASLEQRDDPQLRGKPVAVGTGVVASCSYEARRDGVRTGMRLAEARWRCRNLIVVPGEYLRYEQAARQMLAICQERTPLVEAAALDDLYLDVTKMHGPEAGERGVSTPRCPLAPLPG